MHKIKNINFICKHANSQENQHDGAETSKFRVLDWKKGRASAQHCSTCLGSQHLRSWSRRIITLRPVWATEENSVLYPLLKKRKKEKEVGREDEIVDLYSFFLQNAVIINFLSCTAANQFTITAEVPSGQYPSFNDTLVLVHDSSWF